MNQFHDLELIILFNIWMEKSPVLVWIIITNRRIGGNIPLANKDNDNIRKLLPSRFVWWCLEDFDNQERTIGCQPTPIDVDSKWLYTYESI